MGVNIGNSPSSHVTLVRTVSRPMGKLIQLGPDRVDSATAHLLRSAKSSLPLWIVKLANSQSDPDTGLHGQQFELATASVLSILFTFMDCLTIARCIGSR